MIKIIENTVANDEVNSFNNIEKDDFINFINSMWDKLTVIELCTESISAKLEELSKK